MFGGLIPLAIIGAIVYAIVKNAQGRSGKVRDPGEAPLAVKRVLVFGSLYAALHVAAWGTAGLLALLSDDVVNRGERAAEPLAMTIVAVPIVFFLARWVWQGIDDRRQRDAAFGLYVNVTTLTALIVVMVTAINFGEWLVAAGDYSASMIGALIVWFPIWAVHWWLGRRYRAEVSNGHVYLGSLGILATLTTYAALLIDDAFGRLLDAGTTTSVRTAAGSDVEAWIVGLVVSGAAFGVYWFATGLRENRDALWHAYVVLVGILGGLIAAVTGAGIAAYGVLQWLLGDPESTSAVRHFDDFIPALTVLLVGGAVWLYHRTVLGPVRGPRTEVQRVYDYVVAGVGLITAIVGATILLIALQEAVFPPEDSMASSVNALLGAITTLAVGVPLWLQSWRRAGRFRAHEDGAEIESPTRRSYLFGIVGFGGAAAAISLLILLIVVFDAVLGEGGDRLREAIQIPVGILVTVGAAATYHLMVLRADQRAAPEPAAKPKKLVLVTADDEFAAAVRELTGARVTVLHRLDSNGEIGDPEAVAAAVAASEHEDLLVVAASGALQVIPYRR